ncbi:MAG: hypothetical protein AAGI68_08410 [Planctomycetota bacterium]
MAQSSAGPNVYTALLFAAFVVLAAGVVYTWLRVNAVFDTWLPWFG